ncbi:MAG: EmrB/QacA family drug resistance transporter [Puniceicoccaceae bacterium 5H]|nr:MAG: EmrB/QacA family drug resistance transporter [Puniceicoccaceae bacterium 5H]
MNTDYKPTIRSVLPWLVAIAFFIETLDATILNTAAPTIADSLQVAPLSLKAALTSYALSLAVFIPVSGWVADRLGTRLTFSSAMALFGLGSLLCGLALNLPMLVASRILQGMGGSLMIPVGRIAMVRTYPRSQLIRALNFVIIPGLLGPLLGPLAGGLIVEWFPWRFIFWVNLPFCLAGVLMARRHMPDYREEDSPPLDWRGFLLFGSGVGLLAYALEVLGEHMLPRWAVGVIVVLAVALISAYLLTARRKERPLLALDLFKVRTFRISVVGAFLTRLSVGGMTFLLPLLYQIGLGFPPWKAGLLMMPTPAAAICMKFMTGPILQRIGHLNALRWNTLLLGGVVAAYSLISPGRPLVLIVCLAFMHGFFMSLQFTSVNSLAYADIPNERTSGASTITSTAQQMSLSFGIATASFLAILFLGGIHDAEPGVFAWGLHRTFWILGGLTALSSAVFLGLRQDDGNNVSNRDNRVREPATSAQEATLRTHSRRG